MDHAIAPASPKLSANQSSFSASLVIGVAWGFALLALALGPVYGTWLAPLAIALPAAIAVTAIAWWSRGARWSSVAAAISLVVLAVAVIQQGRGMIELHFGILIAIAVLVVYRDWLPATVAATAAIGYVVGAHYAQQMGAPVFVFPPASPHAWAMVSVHACYFAIEAALVGAIAWWMGIEAARHNTEFESLESAARSAQDVVRDDQSTAIIERLRMAMDRAEVNLRLADIDGTVTYANRPLLDYYSGRSIWLLRPDESQVLIPYPLEKP